MLLRRTVFHSQAREIFERDPGDTILQRADCLYPLVGNGGDGQVKVGEQIARCVEHKQSVVRRDTPKISGLVFFDVVNAVGTNLAMGVQDGFKSMEVVPVISYEPVPGGKPHETLSVLYCVRDVALHEYAE